MVTFVSFYTDDDLYPKHAANLVESLERFGLAHDVVKMPPFSSWLNTVNHKPRFCLEMLDKHKSNVVWVDCDAEIVSPPNLFDELICDVAVCYRDRPQIPHELLTGTVFLAYNSVTYEVVNAWKKECERYQMTDQMVLDKILKKRRHVNVFSLPFGYTKIFDANDMLGQPVIVHWQASRELKRRGAK